MIVKASIEWLTAISDAELASQTDNIVTAVTGNANFPMPSPSLGLISSALAEFRAAVANAAGGGKELTAIKNAKRAALVSLLRQLASYLTITSAHDLAKLLSSKFPNQKPTRTKVGQLPAPESPVLRQGKPSGQLDASVTPVYGASSYNWRVALASAPETYLQTAQTVGGRTSFKGLTPGESYLVEANAVGAEGPSDWSDDAEMMVV